MQALGIDNMKNTSTLMRHFMPFTYCKKCLKIVSDGTKRKGLDQNDSQSEMHSVSTNITDAHNLEKLIEEERRDESDDNKDVDPDLEPYISSVERLDKKEKARQSIYHHASSVLDDVAVVQYQTQDCVHHEFVIETGNVLAALREYTTVCLNRRLTTAIGSNTIIVKTTPATTMYERLSRKRRTISRLLSKDDILTYWARFREIFTGDCLWSSLENGLKIYLKILQRRDALDTECEHLRKQNAELTRMLKPFMKNQ